jgi:DNA-binding response OmpR family regulator
MDRDPSGNSDVVVDRNRFLYSRPLAVVDSEELVKLVAERSVTPTRLDNKIYVVDDNEHIARALGAVLQRAGYEAVVFLTGKSALDQAQLETPAAVLVDIHLPDINGLIVSQKLREQFGPGVPIIVVSGDTSMENLNALSHVGATYFFSKPTNATSLVSYLREWLPKADISAA